MKNSFGQILFCFRRHLSGHRESENEAGWGRLGWHACASSVTDVVPAGNGYCGLLAISPRIPGVARLEAESSKGLVPGPISMVCQSGLANHGVLLVSDYLVSGEGMGRCYI